MYGHIPTSSIYSRGRAAQQFNDSSPEINNHREQYVALEIQVRDNNVDQALKVLKKKLQREGIYREMKLRRAYEKPSEKRQRQQAEAIRRARKLARKRAQRDER